MSDETAVGKPEPLVGKILPAPEKIA